MEGKVTVTIVNERHEGPIGNDWRYWLEAKVFNQGLKGQGIVKVKKHSFPENVIQEPPGPPAPMELAAGDSGNQVKIRLTLEATEVDLFKNDVGIITVDDCLDFPAPGAEPSVHDKLISVGVVESPGLTGETSIFSLMVRLELSC